ncbi:MAG: AAA family ATPase [Bryobacteraceae bacterium]
MSVIAISRGSLSAARKLAEGLGSKLGSTVITREEVLEAAERYGISETGLEMRHIVAQHPPGFWEKYADARRHYLACFKAALFDFVLQGPVIYHGNLAHFLLDEVPFVLRVRVNAPMEDRVATMMAELGISRYDAIHRIEAIDRDRKQWTQFLYDVDVRNAAQFDVVLNLSRITVGEAVQMVVDALKNERFRPSDESFKLVRDLRLATIAQIRLMNNPDTYGLDFKVTADSSIGKVTVAGNLHGGDAKLIEKEIRSALSDIEAVRQIETKVKIG